MNISGDLVDKWPNEQEDTTVRLISPLMLGKRAGQFPFLYQDAEILLGSETVPIRIRYDGVTITSREDNDV